MSATLTLTNERWARTVNWLSNTTSHEVAHNLGLSHVENNTTPRDLMMRNWSVSERFAQNDTFQNTALKLAQGTGTQNSVARLAYEVGLRNHDPNVTPQAPASAGSSLDMFLEDIQMQDAVVVFTTEVGFVDSMDDYIATKVMDLGQVSGDQNVSYFLGQSYFPLQVTLVGKSSVGGDFDLVFGSGFSDSSFAPFSSIEDVIAALLADRNLSTLDDLAAGFTGWDLLNSSSVQGHFSGSVMPVPEPSTFALLTLFSVALLSRGVRKRHRR